MRTRRSPTTTTSTTSHQWPVVLVLSITSIVLTMTNGYVVPWGTFSSRTLRQPWRQSSPSSSVVFLAEKSSPSTDSGPPHPPNTPPPVSFFAAPKEEIEASAKDQTEDDDEVEPAARLLLQAEEKAQEEAEAARMQAEAEEAETERVKQQKIAGEQEAKRQAEEAAQLLLGAERKAQEEAEQRRLREEENRRRQEEFREWTNRFVNQVITPAMDIQKGVSSDRIKGAALTGAALGLLAGNSVGVAGAASLTAAYLSISKGVAGDVLRTVGGVAWDATDTTMRLLQILEVPTSKLTADLSERAMTALRKVQLQQASIVDSTSADVAGDVDQVAQDFLDLTKLMQEADAVIDEADAAIANAQQEEERLTEEAEEEDIDVSVPYDAAAVLAYRKETKNVVAGMTYNTVVQTPAFQAFQLKWKEVTVAEIAAKALEKKIIAEEKRLAEEKERRAKEEAAQQEDERIKEEERIADEEAIRLALEEERLEQERLALVVEEEDFDMDGEEWAAAVEMAQEGLEGKIVGVEEMIADNNAKAEWDAAGVLAQELNADGEDDMEDEDDFNNEFDFESLDMEALGKAAREAVEFFETNFEEDEDLRNAQKQDWADAMITDDDDDDNDDDDGLFSLGSGISGQSTSEGVPYSNGSVIPKDDVPSPLPLQDYSTMKVADLRDMLRSRGLKTQGKKVDLVKTLEEDDLATLSPDDFGGDEEVEMIMEDIDMEELDLEEIGRQARAAVQIFETRDPNMDIEEPTEDILAQLEREIALLSGDSVDYTEMTVAELKEECRSKGLKVTGKKSELIERLEAAA